eukprot:CAMPEP_0194135504 /NCGR_PEP_ID=MMETSP0152-20130528/5606_1 /TAXON_ID=1049557 /ORGANISM="Thalassiothrix antarctica, Strain L6-D1" /LENGTH=192 /DNA_ID=CAMNT_0038831783 /DNA_START=53 /DNA_END=631 /DNA_ORIENTATION=-
MISSALRLALPKIVARSSSISSRFVAAATTTARRTITSREIDDLKLGQGLAKTDTGLTGLLVDHESIPKMIIKYQLLLDTMANSDMPEWYEYRKVIEKMARYRIQACMDHPEDPDMVEELCNCGQVEELVEQADDEMEVMQMILKEKWWERIAARGEDIEFDYNPDPFETAENVTWEDPPPNMDDAQPETKA